MKIRALILIVFITFSVRSFGYFHRLYIEKIIIEKDTFFLESSPILKILTKKKVCILISPTIFTWQIENGKLYLLNDSNIFLSDCNELLKSISLSDVFSEKPINGKFFASILSDKLILNYGKGLAFPRMRNNDEFENYYENQKEIIVKKGKVIKILDYHNIENNGNFLSAFDKVTFDSIIHVLNKNMNWELLPKETKEKFNEMLILHISKKGNTYISLYDEEGIKDGGYEISYVDQKKYKIELNRILKNIKWNPILKNEKPINAEIQIDIGFNFKEKKIYNPYIVYSEY